MGLLGRNPRPIVNPDPWSRREKTHAADKVSTMKKIIYTSFLFLAACGTLSLVACGSSMNTQMDGLANQIVQDVPCQNNFKTTVWDGLKEYIIQQKQAPSSKELSEQVRVKLAQTSLNPAQQDELAAKMDDLFTALLDETAQGERIESPEQLLVLISAIDVGDRTTPFRSYMVNKAEKLFAGVKQSADAMSMSCASDDNGSNDGSSTVTNPPRTTPGSFDSYLSQATAQGLHPAVVGERWTLATAYQSCNTLKLPAMTKTTPAVDGIEIFGTHPDGVGSKRKIASLSKVQATHYYIKDEKSYGASCFNVRNNPLIYDYGGKPYGTTAADSTIDLFKNNGDGTSVLGIDCSGFVYTSYAATGLRLKSGRAAKASDSWAWGSSSYVEPQNNGLSCLEKIKVTPTSGIQSGDIVAIYGHVFMVDKVGADPFGLNATQSVSDCSKISAKNFDFVIAQSSNSKNGIGINRYEIKDYATEKSGTIQDGLQKYAYYACLAKYNKTTYTPSLGNLSVVRHKGTADCLGTRVKLEKEACIQSCAP